MKFSKLALATVAAFGLAGVAQADGTYYVQEGLELWNPSEQNFVTPQTGANEVGNYDQTGAVWFGDAAEDTQVLGYEGIPSINSIPTVNGDSMGVGSKYLKVSNSSPLWRVLKPYKFETKPAEFTDLVASDDSSMDVAVGDGLYVDTLVQFTPSEDAPTPEPGSKLIVWMNINSNLCVTASKITVYTPEESEYPIAEFANANFETGKELKTNTWYRLTVKAYSTVLDDGGGTVKHGFKVYIDGAAVASAAAAVEINDDFVEAMGDFAGSEALEADFNAGKLFLSLSTAEDATLAAVGFKGEGLVDDIVISDVDPISEEAPAGGIDFTLTWGEGVSAVWYAINGGDFKQATKDGEIHLDDGKTIEIEADPEPWYSINAASIPAQADLENDQTYTITATEAATGEAAGVNGELAGFTAAQLKAAFPDKTPTQINEANNAYLDYQFGQGLGTFAANAEPKLEIVGIEPNATAGWDISVQVLAAAGGDAVAVGNMKASLMVIRSSTLAGLSEAQPAVLGTVPVYNSEDKVYTFTETSGQFFKAYIQYAVPANN